jgi:hypothetical protein
VLERAVLGVLVDLGDALLGLSYLATSTAIRRESAYRVHGWRLQGKF